MSFFYQVLTVHSFKNPSSIVSLNTQKKCKCYDTKNNVEKPHDSLGGDGVIRYLYACISNGITWTFHYLICLKGSILDYKVLPRVTRN